MDESCGPSLCELDSLRSSTDFHRLSPFLNQKICLMQSYTEEQDLSILECTGMTPTFSSPIPNLTVRVPSFSQSGPFASPFAMACPFGKASPFGKVSPFGRGTPIEIITEGTPVKVKPIMLSDFVMFGSYDDIDYIDDDSKGREICDDDAAGYCSYDSDDSHQAKDNVSSIIDEEDENAVFAEYGYKKYLFTCDVSK